MPQTITPVYEPIQYLVGTLTDTSFVLLAADFTTQIVSSPVLPSYATQYLTFRLQQMFSKAEGMIPESSFAGILRNMISAWVLELDAPGQLSVAYSSPTATVSVTGLDGGQQCTVAISVPNSNAPPIFHGKGVAASSGSSSSSSPDTLVVIPDDLTTMDGIQAGYDKAVSLAPRGSGATLLLPAINYVRLGKPLRMYASNIRVEGRGERQTTLPLSHGFGPMVCMMPETGLPLVPSVNGGVHSFVLSSVNDDAHRYWLNFDDSPFGSDLLNGATGFCFEIIARTTTSALQNAHISSSYGQKDGTAPVNCCYSVATAGATTGLANSINFQVKTSNGGTGNLNSSAGIPNGTLVHIACRYDGSFMRINFDGVLVGKLAKTGAMVRDRWEQHTFGIGAFNGIWEKNFIAGMPDMVVDLIKISNRDPYTGDSFGVIRGFGFDNHTQARVDFNNPWGNYIGGSGVFDSRQRGYYLIRMMPDMDASHAVDGGVITNIGFAGAANESGIAVLGSTSCNIDNVRIGQSGMYGLYQAYNSFYSRTSRLFIGPGGGSTNTNRKFEILSGAQSGLSAFREINIHSNAAYTVALQSSGGGKFQRLDIEPESGQLAAFYAVGGDVPSEININAMSNDNEGQANDTITSLVELVDQNKLLLQGSTLSLGGCAVPLIKYRITTGSNGWFTPRNALCLVGCDFNYSNGSETAVFDVASSVPGAQVERISAVGCPDPVSPTQWLNDPGNIVQSFTKI